MTRREINICASLACADMLNLGRDLRDLADAGVDWLHIDVMDGSFVPNFALSPDLMRVVSKASGVPLDVHLMVREPERYLERFVEAGASILVVHEEATVHLQRTLSRIRALGATPGVALNPSTSLHTLEYVLEDIELLLIMTVNPGHVGQKLVPGMLRKIADARAMLDGQGRAVDIQAARTVADLGVEAVITGNVGPKAFATLQAAFQVLTAAQARGQPLPAMCIPDLRRQHCGKRRRGGGGGGGDGGDTSGGRGEYGGGGGSDDRGSSDADGAPPRRRGSKGSRKRKGPGGRNGNGMERGFTYDNGGRPHNY